MSIPNFPQMEEPPRRGRSLGKQQLPSALSSKLPSRRAITLGSVDTTDASAPLLRSRLGPRTSMRFFSPTEAETPEIAAVSPGKPRSRSTSAPGPRFNPKLFPAVGFDLPELPTGIPLPMRHISLTESTTKARERTQVPPMPTSPPLATSSPVIPVPTPTVSGIPILPQSGIPRPGGRLRSRVPALSLRKGAATAVPNSPPLSPLSLPPPIAFPTPSIFSSMMRSPRKRTPTASEDRASSSLPARQRSLQSSSSSASKPLPQLPPSENNAGYQSFSAIPFQQDPTWPTVNGSSEWQVRSLEPEELSSSRSRNTSDPMTSGERKVHVGPHLEKPMPQVPQPPPEDDRDISWENISAPDVNLPEPVTTSTPKTIMARTHQRVKSIASLRSRISVDQTRLSSHEAATPKPSTPTQQDLSRPTGNRDLDDATVKARSLNVDKPSRNTDSLQGGSSLAYLESEDDDSEHSRIDFRVKPQRSSSPGRHLRSVSNDTFLEGPTTPTRSQAWHQRTVSHGSAAQISLNDDHQSPLTRRSLATSPESRRPLSSARVVPTSPSPVKVLRRDRSQWQRTSSHSSTGSRGQVKSLSPERDPAPAVETQSVCSTRERKSCDTMASIDAAESTPESVMSQSTPSRSRRSSRRGPISFHAPPGADWATAKEIISLPNRHSHRRNLSMQSSNGSLYDHTVYALPPLSPVPPSEANSDEGKEEWLESSYEAPTESAGPYVGPYEAVRISRQRDSNLPPFYLDMFKPEADPSNKGKRQSVKSRFRLPQPSESCPLDASSTTNHCNETCSDEPIATPANHCNEICSDEAISPPAIGVSAPTQPPKDSLKRPWAEILPRKVMGMIFYQVPIDKLQPFMDLFKHKPAVCFNLTLDAIGAVLDRSWKEETPASEWRHALLYCLKEKLAPSQVHLLSRCPFSAKKRKQSCSHDMALHISIAKERWAATTSNSYKMDSHHPAFPDTDPFAFFNTHDDLYHCRRQHQDEVDFVCTNLVKLHNELPPGKSHSTLEHVVTSQPFKNMWRLMSQNVISAEFSCTVRLLSHTFCLYLGAATMSWPARPTKAVCERLLPVPQIDFDGKVVWEEVWAIVTVLVPLARHFVESGHYIGDVRRALDILPISKPLPPIPRPNTERDTVWDWANISGLWHIAMGTYPQSKAALPVLESWDWVQLAPCRKEEIASVLFPDDRVEAPHDLGSLETALPWSDTLPPLYFQGSRQSNSVDQVDYYIRGVARLTTDQPPEVRIKIIFHNNATLRDEKIFEGIQLGGCTSPRGAMGVASAYHSLTPDPLAELVVESTGDSSIGRVHRQTVVERVPDVHPCWFLKLEAGDV